MMYLACDGLIELLISLVHVDLSLSTDAEAGDAVHSYRELPADLFLGLGFRNHLTAFSWAHLSITSCYLFKNHDCVHSVSDGRHNMSWTRTI